MAAQEAGFPDDQCWPLRELKSGHMIISAPGEDDVVATMLVNQYTAMTSIALDIEAGQRVSVRLNRSTPTDMTVIYNTPSRISRIYNGAIAEAAIRKDGDICVPEYDADGRPEILDVNGHYVCWCRVAFHALQKQLTLPDHG